MKKRPWLKRVGIVLCVVMIVIIAVVFDHVRKANEAERAELRKIAREYEEIMRPLWAEKSRLEQEITEQEKVVKAEAPPSPVILLCSEPNEKIYSDVYSITHRYRYPAVIVVSENAFPGETGCLSERDTIDLCDRGWEICLRADADTDLAALYQRVTDAGLPSPVAVYYPTNDVTKEQEEQVLALGIRTLIRYGRIPVDGETEGLWYLSAYGSNESDSKSVFQTRVRNAAAVALTVGFSNNREQFSATNYGNMLKTVNSYEQSGDVEVLSIQDASDAYLMQQSSAYSEPETEAQRYLRELKEELDAVNAKIWNLEKEEK